MYHSGSSDLVNETNLYAICDTGTGQGCSAIKMAKGALAKMLPKSNSKIIDWLLFGINKGCSAPPSPSNTPLEKSFSYQALGSSM